jgi:sec-independent protein translocase protein TatA
MGPVGVQEMVFIFLLALLLFGPKKLPEVGRMVGKALSEFRRAQNELKSTFEREMRNLEQETNLKEITGNFSLDNYNYDYSSYESGTQADPYGELAAGAPDAGATDTATGSASATEGAVPAAAAPEGVIAREAETAAEGHPPEEGAPAAGGSTTTAS